MSADGVAESASFRGSAGADPAVGPTTAAPVGADALRAIMRAFATGITVVTTRDRGTDHGMTVNSFTSVSLHPSLVLVCLARGTRTLEAVRRSGRFAVTILGEDQRALSTRFAQPIANRFTDLDVTRDHLGVPILSAGIAYMRCSVAAVHDGGDHEIIVGSVCSGSVSGGGPLIYFDGGYTSLAET